MSLQAGKRSPAFSLSHICLNLPLHLHRKVWETTDSFKDRWYLSKCRQCVLMLIFTLRRKQECCLNWGVPEGASGVSGWVTFCLLPSDSISPETSSQQAQQSPVSTSYSPKRQGNRHAYGHTLLFVWVLRIWVQVLMLTQVLINHWTISLESKYPLDD